ncbi:MAG: hypothetical protein F6K56_33090 [Moorea sp. SIO3G5]|nr:hypothetical protein [Moorena sp. SIO3G5]
MVNYTGDNLNNYFKARKEKYFLFLNPHSAGKIEEFATESLHLDSTSLS